MKKINISGLILIAIISIFMSGCAFNNNNNAASDVTSQVIARYDAITEHKNQKVSASSEMHVVGIFKWGENNFADKSTMGSKFTWSGVLPIVELTYPALVLAKSAAVYKACKNNNADILLGARYEIKTMDYLVYQNIKCTVTGYPAVIKGIKPAK